MRARPAFWFLLAAAVGVYALSRTKRGAAAASSALEFVAVNAQRMFTWSPPASAAPYERAIADAEKANGLPPNLLMRMAYQESRFREDIITGQTVSSAGAIGILQIVPKWHPGVNPYDPFDSIRYAAKYVRTLFNRFGDWKLALAAYNAGPTNVQKYSGVPPFAETQAYVEDIAGDVGLV